MEYDGIQHRSDEAVRYNVRPCYQKCPADPFRRSSSSSSSDRGFESSNESDNDNCSNTLSSTAKFTEEKHTNEKHWKQLALSIVALNETGKLYSSLFVAQLINHLTFNRQQLNDLGCRTKQLVESFEKIQLEEGKHDSTNRCLTIALLNRADCFEKQQNQVLSSNGANKTTNQWRPCPRLRHYRQQQQQQQQQVCILQFSDRPFNADQQGPVCGVPQSRADMHSEANRLATFEDAGEATCWTTTDIGEDVSRALARAGWFRSNREGGLRCAFCYGNVDAAAARRSLASYAGGDRTFWPMQLHQYRFGTCPMVLQLAVGNRPLPEEDREASEPKPLRAPVACSEDNDPSSSSGSWTTENAASSTVAPSSESEARHQLRRRPGLPTATLAAARSACDPRADSNLSLLERSLLIQKNSCDVAVETYHPLCYPEMSDPAEREATLTATAGQLTLNSSSSAVVPLPASLLAQAGFFQLSGTDCLACYWCGVNLRHWLPDDEPWIEHARWSPRCCHLLLERGADFVLSSRRLHPPYVTPLDEVSVSSMTSVSSSSTSSKTTPVGSAAKSAKADPPSVCIDYRIELRQLRSRDDTFIVLLARQLLDGGYCRDVRTAVAEKLRNTGADFTSGQLLLSAVMDVRQRRERLGLDSAQYHDLRMSELDDITLADAEHLNSDAEIDWRACKVCMDRRINVTLMDCGHFCCCSNCSRSLSDCPVCRAPIRATLLIRPDS
ncbi:hypothetical protein BOX15_Mlig014850g1 [Macrostomum lignano]|uniref:RING-type domain-containing protein n=2 Tax=Macrostomum lignano TaxID=282301 RepID=A0A267DIH5_9PLAT|nr:hypothetical protein BOX15_Mlig014850g2 [Macrostomum lignano]PAA85114.1 hypothetical protein BOX15_Mlig014850g1 [Macrostomum lignano]